MMCDWLDATPVEATPNPSSDIPPDRFLRMNELTQVYQTVDPLGYTITGLIKLLIINGQRHIEVALMRWADIDLAARHMASLSDEPHRSRDVGDTRF